MKTKPTCLYILTVRIYRQVEKKRGKREMRSLPYVPPYHEDVHYINSFVFKGQRVDNGEYIIGRMGIPYKKRMVNIISIALDAPQNTTSELAGKIGKLEGVNVKTSFSGVISNDE